VRDDGVDLPGDRPDRADPFRQSFGLHHTPLTVSWPFTDERMRSAPAAPTVTLPGPSTDRRRTARRRAYSRVSLEQPRSRASGGSLGEVPSTTETSLRRTPLYERHVAAGARIVPY